MEKLSPNTGFLKSLNKLVHSEFSEFGNKAARKYLPELKKGFFLINGVSTEKVCVHLQLAIIWQRQSGQIVRSLNGHLQHTFNFKVFQRNLHLS